MQISSSSIGLSAAYSATSSVQSSATLRTWVGNTRPDFAAIENGSAPHPSPQQVPPPPAASVSDPAIAQQPGPPQASQNAADQADNDPSTSLLKLMVEMLVGHKIKLFSAADLQPAATVTVSPPADTQPVAHNAGFGIEYNSQTTQTQTEQSTFQAQGTVHTADGRDIAVQLDLTMSSETKTQSTVSFTAGDAVRKDPLVINFGGGSAQLLDQHFNFDLDSNGKPVSVPLLGPNSGYLVLDKNGNGKIDSGSELFGAQSGNGFADLARYDSGGKGWIDQSDPVFNQLRVWTPDGQGGGTLQTLQQLGVGALYLGQTGTPFTLKDNSNTTLGDVRASGIYLTESGKAGTLQQIDLVV